MSSISYYLHVLGKCYEWCNIRIAQPVFSQPSPNLHLADGFHGVSLYAVIEVAAKPLNQVPTYSYTMACMM